MKQAEKILKNPAITTTWPLNDRVDTQTAIRKIRDKLLKYNCISPREQSYLDKHTVAKS